MKLDQECILLQNELRKFSQQVLAEKVDELDKAAAFPSDIIKQLAEMGILGAIIPEEMDGAALNLIGLVVSLEELSKVCASTATIVATHNAFFTFPILKFGTDDMRKKYLPLAATGEIIGGYGLPDTNEVAVTKQNDTFTMNGKTLFLLNGEAAGPFITAVDTDKEETQRFVVLIEQNKESVVCTKNNSVLGLKAAGIAKATYSDLPLTPDIIIGGKEKGAEILQATLDFANVCLAAVALGIAQAAAREALKYARERVQFDQPIINFGMIREKIADMNTRIEAARSLVYDAALQYDEGKKYTRSAAMAKYFTGEAAVDITTQAIQVFGGYGYMKDYPVERYFRDAQVINVLGSTPIQGKEVTAKETIG